MAYRYEFVTAAGKSCCRSNDVALLCVHCRAAAAEAEHECPAPDPYAEGIEELRRANARQRIARDLLR